MNIFILNFQELQSYFSKTADILCSKPLSKNGKKQKMFNIFFGYGLNLFRACAKIDDILIIHKCAIRVITK